MSLTLICTCALGLEELLGDELRALEVAAVELQRGAVACRGDWTDVVRLNWRLATANRVLVALGTFNGGDGDALRAGARNLVRRRHHWLGLDAGRLFHPDRTFAVHATCRASRIRDRRWVALTVKDGIADGQRDRYGRRGSVDREDPDTALRVFLYKDQATLLLDTSGDPLDRRGYRGASTAAPLRETLAAAMVLASGWDGRGAVVDPMCGSGTLLAEAAAYALGRAPGRLRRRWAFEALPHLDRQVFTAVRAEPIPAPGPEVRLYGRDLDPTAVAASRANLEAAGLGERSEIEPGDAFDGQPPPGASGGLFLVNPPWGERLAEDAELWRRLGDLLKQRFAGWTAVVIAGDAGRGKHIGLRPRRRLPVLSGPKEARILVFELY